MKLQRHQYEIVELARGNPAVTRPFLAESLSLSLPTVSTAVRALIDSGLLRENGFLKSSGGRRAAILTMNPNWAHSLGISVSMKGVCGVVANLGGALLYKERIDWGVQLSRDTILDSLYDVAHKLVDSSDKPLSGIGLGVTGLVSSDEGLSLRFPYLEDWKDVPLRALLAERFGLPVHIDNDVNASTLAELRFGKGRGVGNFLYVFIGNGIGLGIVVGGKRYVGSSGNAGELGHLAVADDGLLCHCGNYGCLETIAGPAAITRDIEQALAAGAISAVRTDSQGKVSMDAVLDAADLGDRLAENVVSKASEHIGRMMANMANIFDPELIIMGGLLARGSERVMDSLKRVFDMRVLPSIAPNVELQVSGLGDIAGALGAADVVFEHAIQALQSD